MKTNWSKLYEDKCPTPHCLTGGIKTTIVKEREAMRCPRCGGKWALVCFAPTDITWIEVVRPHNKIVEQTAVKGRSEE